MENYFSQLAVVPSPRSMLSRDRSMPLDTWNLSGTQGNVFGNTRHMLDVITDVLSRNSSLNESKCYRRKPSVEKYRGTCRWKWRTNWKHNSNAYVCREAVNHELFTTSWNSTEFCGWSAKTANIGASVWQISHTFDVFMLEDKIPNPGKLMLRFSVGAMWRIKEVEMVHSVDDLKSIALNPRVRKFWNAGRTDCFCFEQDHSEFLLQEEGQSRGTESSERGSVPSRKRDRSHDLRLLSSHWCSWYRSWLYWFILYHSS